jgi:nicotinamidase-related amidase
MKKFGAVIFIFILFSGCAGFISSTKFSASDTALLVIDVQYGYLPVYNQGYFIPRIKSLVEKAHKAKVPVIYIRNLDDFNKEGTQGWKFHISIRPGDNDYILEKNYPSAFTNPELEKLLDKLKIENLVLTGLASSGCYGATVSEGNIKGYNIIVVKDAHRDQIKGRAEILNKRLENSNNIRLIETEDIIFTSTR